MSKVNLPESITGHVLYAIRNSDGQWFRRKGYGGRDESWTPDFTKARIYARIGGARGVIGFFANNYPKYPAPNLVSLLIDRVEVINEAERIAKQKIAKQNAENKREHRRLTEELKRAQIEFDRMKSRLEDAQRGAKKANIATSLGFTNRYEHI